MATILIVDNHETNREYLSSLLTQSGHQVLTAADGQEALRLVQEKPCGLIISNILMPTMDGRDFVNKLRDNAATADIPVVFCAAAYHAREARQLAKACGAREVLTLPADADDILSTVKAALEGSSNPPSVSLAKSDLDALRIRNRSLLDKSRDMVASNLRLKAVLAMGDKLARERDPRKLVEMACEAAREIIGAKYAGACLFEVPGQSQTCVAAGMDEAQAAYFPSSRLFAVMRGHLEKTRSIRLHNLKSSAKKGAIPVGSAACARIETPTRRHGILYCLSKIGSNEFSAEDRQLLQALSGQVAVCYESACRLSEVTAAVRAQTQEATERKRSEKRLRENEECVRQLSNRLLQLQDDERRHIARELHDSTSQGLAIVAMNLDWLRQNTATPSAETERILSESREQIEKCAREIRTTSYLLHPPLLDDVGLIGALNGFAKGFERRSGIAVTLDAPAQFGRLPREVEVTFFRVVQESLANIHNHSGSPTAAIRVSRNADKAVLEIEDRGRGFPSGIFQDDGAASLGIGILGMRERLKQLGGVLEIVSRSTGVVVRAIVPLGPVTK